MSGEVEFGDVETERVDDRGWWGWELEHEGRRKSGERAPPSVMNSPIIKSIVLSTEIEDVSLPPKKARDLSAVRSERPVQPGGIRRSVRAWGERKCAST